MGKYNNEITLNKHKNFKLIESKKYTCGDVERNIWIKTDGKLSSRVENFQITLNFNNNSFKLLTNNICHINNDVGNGYEIINIPNFENLCIYITTIGLGKKNEPQGITKITKQIGRR